MSRGDFEGKKWISKCFFFLCSVLLLLLFFYLPLLGRGLNEPDEGRYANIAAGFLEPHAELLEPRLSGYGHYDKPPLVYWASASCLALFGFHEWAARLPSLLGATMTLLGLGWSAYRLYGKRVAWWSVLICSTMLQFWVLARFLTPDMFMCGWCFLGVGAWSEARARGKAWGWWLLSLLFWTAAWWTKATPALVPVLTLGCSLALVKDWAGLRALRPLLLLSGIIVLGLPWYLIMIHRHPELIDFFLHRQMLGHISGHGESRRGPLYYYVLLSPLAWMPWSVIVPLLLMAMQTRIHTVWQQCKMSLEMWVSLLGFLIFSLNSSKLPTYTLPLIPWVALIIARGIASLEEAQVPSAKRLFYGMTLVAPLCWILILWISLQAVYPARETQLGANSSLRSLSNRLQQEHAQTIWLDRYWPSFELYFRDGTIHYLVPNWIQQRAGETPLYSSSHHADFRPPEELISQLRVPTSSNLWLVHFKKTAESAEMKQLMENFPALQKIESGDFVLIQLR